MAETVEEFQARTANEAELQAGLLADVGKLRLERAGTDVVNTLTEARQRVEELRDKLGEAIPAIDDDDIEPFLRDVRGASSTFLSKTSLEKANEAREKKQRYDPKAEDGWVTLRFRITGEQRDIIVAAMERAREVAGISGKLWKGQALEWVAADFMAGHGELGQEDKGGFVPPGMKIKPKE